MRGDTKIKDNKQHKLERTPSPEKTPKDDLPKKQKVAAIKKALGTDPVDIPTLRQLAISKHGLVNDELRAKAWPKLLNVNIYDIPKKPSQTVLKEHRDYNQVVLDVNRSLKRFPPGMKDEQREVLQEQLVDVIMRVLVGHSELHYYQGYHDICVTFLLVVKEDIAFALVDQLSTNHLRDFMDVNMDRTTKMLSYLYPILDKANPELRDFMEDSCVGYIFCLSWLITWFGHVLSDFRHVVRLYDFFIACHPLMPVYMAAAIVLYRQDEVLESDCEMCSVHSLLSKIPDDLPYEQLISTAGDLFLQYPPEKLADEAEFHYNQSTTISNYNKFERSSRNQRPDSVLRRRRKQTEEMRKKEIAVPDQSSHPFVKVTVWALTAALTGAALVVLNVASEWGWFSST